VLGLYSEEIGFFDDEEMKLLTGLTGDISFALENISRQQNLAKLARIRAVSGEINATIVRIHDRDALLRETCRIAVEHGKFELVWIALLDQEKQRIQPVAWAGFSSEVAHDLTWASLSRPGVTLAEVIRTRKVAVRNDVDTEMPAGSLRQVAIKKGYRSTVCVPLVVDDSVVAAIILFAPGQGFFDEEELRLLTGLAGNISFALENISGQQRLGKLSRIRAVSSGINAAIIRIRERKALLEEACRIVSERGKFEMIWIGAIDHDGEQVEPLAWKGFSEEAARAVSWASIGNAKGTLGEAMQTRKASVRNDIEGELPGGKLRHEALKLGCQSSVCLPLVVDDRVTALVVLFAPGRGFFDKDELALLDEVASDISFALQAIEKQKKLEYLSYYDVLTGLANRTLFLERLARYMHSAVSGGHKLAVGLIDLERFKNINDSLGRPAGDALLKQVAEWLTRNLGDTSRLARVGADHFAVVLPEVKADGNMAGLIDGFMTSFLEHPFRLKDAVFRLAFKLGVALFPDDGADADTLLQNAEAALKKAKASGDRYLFYMQKMTNTVAGNLTLENQLRQALDNEEFVLHYQPKVSLESGKLTGAEALIRWNDPRTGLVPPGQFIPILEETGLIFEVGRWALRKSIEDYLRWRAAGLPAVRIAVNVSPLQLRNRGFVAEIEQVIGVDAHAPAGLELEITESLIMQDIKHNIASLKAIQGMGITIAIDDFGTGFSSLAYLSKLPVDTLKIDRSFVIDMTAGAEGLALVSTIINLAHSLKLKVVAEGVETEEQSRLLRLLNCDEMQGFLFSKPVPVEIFETRFLALPSVGG
jgi:diguanylate cyclase (GGDEF)-like protein